MDGSPASELDSPSETELTSLLLTHAFASFQGQGQGQAGGAVEGHDVMVALGFVGPIWFFMQETTSLFRALSSMIGRTRAYVP
jgi:hypothetical protein